MSLNKKLAKLVKNRPQYQINQEAFDNQALATANAFAPDQSIQQQRNILDQDVANTLNQVQQTSSSSSAILSTLAKINDSKNAAMRGLAGDEAAIQRDKMRDLYAANDALSEEKDKAWNFNTNEPYQNQIQMLRDKKKARQENMWRILDTVGSLGVSLLSGGGRRKGVSGTGGAINSY